MKNRIKDWTMFSQKSYVETLIPDVIDSVPDPDP